VASAEYLRVWKQRNKHRVAKYDRDYRGRHPETGRKAALKHRHRNLARIRKEQRDIKRQKRQNETMDQRRARLSIKASKRLAQQEKAAGRKRPNVCDLCSGVGLLGKGIVFDHCHQSGEFRGWLCDRCNKVLGLVYDDPDVLQKMIGYLEKRNGQPDGGTQKIDLLEGVCSSREKISFN